MSLDRLRSFLALAHAGSIAKDAPGDVTRQSQIIRQVGELEAFFGTELTERRGKILALSEAGKRLSDTDELPPNGTLAAFRLASFWLRC